jgi:predicted Zn-dependent peptidase
MNKKEYPQIGETLYSDELPNGLRLFVAPKPGFAKSFAFFATDYGGADRRFKLAGEWNDTPAGVAHFLEHKMFDMPDGNALRVLSANGASPNAYTSTAMTAYHFESTEGFYENLDTLLSFVSTPYFTPESVQKEQGIIGQEIKMTQDDPNWALLFSVLQAMYKYHPVQIEIAGTVESISHITADLLYKCYNTFYNLENMVFCAVGNVDVDTVLEVADRILVRKDKVRIERKFFEEPDGVNKAYVESEMAVTAPLFALGFKENIRTPERTTRELILSQCIIELLSGKTSKLYNELLGDGLINSNFSSEYLFGYGYSSLIFSGESEKYDEVAKRIKAEIDRLSREGIAADDFERVRRMQYGRLIMSFNDIDDIANGVVASYFAGESIFEDAEVLSSITLDEINDRLRSSVHTDCCSLSVIKPKGE